jgi:hypothetical protein
MEMWLNIVRKYNLTLGEQLRILSDELPQIAKWMVRKERHPRNPNKPGDLK